MKAILLDGSQADDCTGLRVRAALTAQLQARCWDVEHVVLREKKIGPCAGDFYCWIRTPGVCNVDDDNRAIAAAIVASDLLVYLTPVTFGGYSFLLKRFVDHQIQNISPFFAKIEGETHHHKRYKANPDLLAVGWMDAPDEQAGRVFRHLVQRNAINWHAQTWVSDIVLAGQPDADLQASARGWLAALENRQSSPPAALPPGGVTGDGTVAIRSALLLVGSPKTRKSSSYSLGGYLFEQLAAHSVETETIYLHTVLRSPAKMQALLEAVDAVDLVVLAFPLYVDSLPAPGIEALERIAAHRQGRHPSQPQQFAAIASCGFPEPYQASTALAICQIFCREAGYAWAGSLALGAGGAPYGLPLVEGGGRTLHMCQSLDLAAEALAEGQAIPQEAQEIMASRPVPPWAYRAIGWLSWTLAARGYGALRQLRRRPYLPETN